MYISPKRSRVRRLKAEWRDAWLLLGRFGTPLLVFTYSAFSATGMAAPAFAAAASGVDMTRPITMEGQVMSLAHLKVEIGSTLVNRTVNEVEQRYNLSVVFIRRNSLSDYHPPAGCTLKPQDLLAVLGGPDEIRTLVSENFPHR